MAAPDRPSHLDSPRVATAIKYMSKANTWVYRRTGGRVGGKWRVGAGLRKPVPTLLLEHRGRKSGKAFTTPLLYLEDGVDIIVVASQGGMPANPQRFHNLVATPDALVQIGSRRQPVRAVVADEAERARLWPLLLGLYADFENYRAWTDREIPILILKPR